MHDNPIARDLKKRCVFVQETPERLEIVFDMRAAKEVRRTDYALFSEYRQEIDCFLDIFMAWQWHHDEEKFREIYFRAFKEQWMILRELGKNAVDHGDWSRFTCKRIIRENKEESMDWEFLTCGRSERPEHLRRYYRSLTFGEREYVETSKAGKGGNHNGGLGTMLLLTSAETLFLPMNIQKEMHSPFIWLKFSGLWHGRYKPGAPQ